MTSERRAGITTTGQVLAGKAIVPGLVQINDCSRPEPREVGMLASKLTLMPTAGGDTFHVYFDEPIKVENISMEETKTFQLWYWTPGGDLLGAGDPIVLHPRQSREVPNPHIV
jgi:hypothetical protein